MSERNETFGRRGLVRVGGDTGVRVGRGTMIAGVVALLLSLLWGGAATTWIVMRDDLAAGLIRRHVDRQRAYEERIASLKLHIDRLTNRQILDQDGVENRVAEIMSRQSEIETRHALIAMVAKQTGAAEPRPRLAAPAGGESEAPVTRQPASLPPTAFAPIPAKPAPVGELPPLLRGLTDKAPPTPPQAAGRVSSLQRGMRGSFGERLTEVRQAMLGIEREQLVALGQIEKSTREKAARFEKALAEAGIKPAAVTHGQGGPFVPIEGRDDAAFEVAMGRIKTLVSDLKTLTRLAAFVPARPPLGYDAEVSSSFGPRVDPFTRGAAMHTGIDFRAETGTAVKATAAGKVVAAEVRGGYGKMVEIDHGNGLTTRYAHLSAILVEEDQQITAGTVVGRVGSTGRSTAPHLHYEIRVNGEAADPLRLLRVGARWRGVF